MLNEFESSFSPAEIDTFSVQRLMQETCRLIRCKCNQNLKRNESAPSVTSVGKKHSITRSFVKDDDT